MRGLAWCPLVNRVRPLPAYTRTNMAAALRHVFEYETEKRGVDRVNQIAHKPLTQPISLVGSAKHRNLRRHL